MFSWSSPCLLVRHHVAVWHLWVKSVLFLWWRVSIYKWWRWWWHHRATLSKNIRLVYKRYNSHKFYHNFIVATRRKGKMKNTLVFVCSHIHHIYARFFLPHGSQISRYFTTTAPKSFKLIPQTPLIHSFIHSFIFKYTNILLITEVNNLQ